MQHPTFGINFHIPSVSLIHILVFHLLTTLHMSDPHCHHHHFHHHSLHFFTLGETPLSQVVSAIDFSIGTRWTDLTASRLDRFLLLIGFVVIFTARSSYASAVLGIVILSVRPSDCPSVTRVLCDKRKEHTADILIPHERVIMLVFWHQQRLVGDVPSHLKFALKPTHPILKNADFDHTCL